LFSYHLQGGGPWPPLQHTAGVWAPCCQRNELRSICKSVCRAPKVRPQRDFCDIFQIHERFSPIICKVAARGHHCNTQQVSGHHAARGTSFDPSASPSAAHPKSVRSAIFATFSKFTSAFLLSFARWRPVATTATHSRCLGTMLPEERASIHLQVRLPRTQSPSAARFLRHFPNSRALFSYHLQGGGPWPPLQHTAGVWAPCCQRNEL